MQNTDFKAWQITHYTRRLSEEQSTVGKSFLRTTLFGLKRALMQDSLSYEEQQLLNELRTIDHDSLWGLAIKNVISNPTVTSFRGLICQLKMQNNDCPEIMRSILQNAYNSFLLC